MGVIKNSIGSLVRNPVITLFEAISAARADVDEATVLLEKQGMFQEGYEVYGESDILVPRPKNRLVHTYDGHHMTPVYQPGIAINVARRVTNSKRAAA